MYIIYIKFLFFIHFQRRSIKKPSIKIRNLWISDCRTHSTFSLFLLLLCVAGGWHEWEREKKSLFQCDLSFDFQERKERKEWKEQHTKKNRNKWMSGKYSRLETCVSREVYHLLYDLFILTQISIKDFFFAAWGLIQWHEWLWIWENWCMNFHWL